MKNPTILVIEDDWTQATIIEDSLKDAGYEVIIADNEESAISCINDEWETIALIISDVLLPLDKHGDELDKAVCYRIGQAINIKNKEKNKPVILMTVYGEEIREEFRGKTGIRESAFFRKPFDVDRLVETMESLLRMKEKTT